MKVLITGANGFVGSYVSRYLMAQGIECVALDVTGAPEGGVYAARYTWDELDTLDFSTFDGVIHLAGKAHDTKNTSDPQSYFDINVGLTRRILSSLVHECDSALVERSEIRGQRSEVGDPPTNELMNYRTNALKFIFFSSVKACADTVEGVLTEECEPNPQTPYGQSKLEAEGVVRSALVRYCVSSLVEKPDGSEQTTNERMNYRTNALSYYILRPAMIMGPGNKGNMKLLTQVVKAGIPWPLGAFENKRSFASIEHVARVVEALLTKDVEPGIYQVADDEPLSTNQLIEQIAASLGKKPRIWKLPRGLMRGIARIGDLLHLPLNSERLKKLTESYVVSNAKLRGAVFATTKCYCDHTVVTME
jgi:nucleoside-diphosphate-sugar epimerase